jgi:hypothetical protein
LAFEFDRFAEIRPFLAGNLYVGIRPFLAGNLYVGIRPFLEGTLYEDSRSYHMDSLHGVGDDGRMGSHVDDNRHMDSQYVGNLPFVDSRYADNLCVDSPPFADSPFAGRAVLQIRPGIDVLTLKSPPKTVYMVVYVSLLG